MRVSERLVLWGLLLSAGMCCSLRAQTQAGSDNQRSCRKVAQEFYAWYASKGVQDQRGRTSDIALKHKGSLFSSELSRALREDSEAQNKDKSGDIVGLDSDPFLGGQDTCAPYSTGKATRTGNNCLVEVRGSSCGKNAKPDVVAELALRNGRWMFVNFHYPQLGEHEDLLSTLQTLRKDRQGRSAK